MNNECFRPYASCPPLALAVSLCLLPLFTRAQEAPPSAPDIPGAVTTVTTTTAAPAVSVVAAPAVVASSTGKGIVLNFQGASLADVLNYLSEAAGFVIVQEAPVSGTVNITSRQAISSEEAVDLLNTVLNDKGYTAIRNGRILKIVARKDAQKRDLPVAMGADPERIPRNDEIVTQVLPLRFGEAAKVIENLRPLLTDSATITANESSNALIMTDTQANIRRIAQIIRALDTSVSSISTINIFPLQFADAKAVADTITQLFSVTQPATTANAGGGRGGGRGFGGGFGPPGFGGAPGGGGGAAQSEARLAAVRVTAVADQQSNSVIVSAPDEVLPTIRQIITQIDTSITDVTQTEIFRLQHADAVELADIMNQLYGDTASLNNQNQNRNNRNGRGGGQNGFGGGFPGGGFGGGFGAPGGVPQAAAAGGQSQRALLQSKVVAVGDPRTNSLLVTAARDTMAEITSMVARLDATQAKKQRVFVHSLQHADADTVASVLRGMLGDTSGNGAAQNATSRLTERTTTGANMDTTASSNQGLGSGSNRGR